MINLQTSRGLPVAVPETIEEGPTVRFRTDEFEQIRKYYDEHGYVVVSQLIDPKLCREVRQLWDDDIKTSDRFLYRQTTCRAERHTLNKQGWIMNPILNLQSVDPRHFGRFRRFATEQILTNPQLAAVQKVLLDDDPKIVQSMYFEGNSATWEHQDSYYLDSENIGKMVGAWIAIEPIEARAGRFFICPGSHLLQYDAHSAENNVAVNHDVFIKSIIDLIKEKGLEIRAPRLEAGDTLLWNSLTIHGSLASEDKLASRSSITCHTIPAHDRFLQHQMRVQDVPVDRVNGVAVYRPKDLAKASNRAVLWLESTFPKGFYWAKKQAINWLASRH